MGPYYSELTNPVEILIGRVLPTHHRASDQGMFFKLFPLFKKMNLGFGRPTPTQIAHIEALPFQYTENRLTSGYAR